MKKALILVLIFSIFRFVYSQFFLLTPDEANYWQWSRYLDWCYYDHPPMVAWGIKLGTVLFGHNEFGVRFGANLAILICSVYIILMASKWLGSREAFYCAILTQGALLFTAGSMLATPDAFQSACWAGSTYHVGCAYFQDRLNKDNRNYRLHWILGGFWFGLGMVSKYSMILFLPCAFLYGLYFKGFRKKLLDIYPYLGVLIGLILFMPVIYWNANNNWHTFRHVAHMGGIDEAKLINFKFFGDYLGSQALLVSPIMFTLILKSWYFVARKLNKSNIESVENIEIIADESFENIEKNFVKIYLFFMSLPVFLIFALISLHSRVYGNWSAIAYITGALLACLFFMNHKKLWFWANFVMYFFTFLVLIQAISYILPIPAKFDRLKTELLGWDILGKKAEDIMNTMPNPDKTFLFGLDYQNASELAFYSPKKLYTVAINKWNRPNVYETWLNEKDYLNLDAVGITGDPMSHKTRLNRIFERVEEPIKIIILNKSEVVKIMYFYKCFGFKNGLKWEPIDKKDIRFRNINNLTK